MRFAIVGCGVIGKFHAEVMSGLPDVELAYVVDPQADRADPLAEKYGARSVRTIDEALTDDVDAAAICVPSGLHTQLAVQALQASKHVVIEKPLDVTPEAVEAIMKESAGSEKTVTVISQHRFDQASQIVRSALDKGKFGRLTSGLASISWWRSQGYYDSGDWRGTWALDGGGALMNQGVHTIDLLVWFFGQPVEVLAYTGVLAHERIEVEDTAAAAIRFADGALATIHGTTAAYPGLTARVQVHGDRGSAVIDGDTLQYFHAATGDSGGSAYGAGGSGNQVDQFASAESGQQAGSEPSALSNAHSVQYRDFLDAIAQGREPLVTVTEAARTFDVVHAIYESARRGGPVKISPR